MAGAFVDGALKGFEMMERHQARKDNKARLADMDKRNDQRYQDSLERQAQLDEERKDNREQDVAYRKSQAKATADYRNSTLEANQQQRQWQQNYQTQQGQWQKDQPAIPLAWQSFRETGQVPEDLNDVLSRNKGMDPRTYLKPEYREAVKGLSTKLDTVIKSGNMAEANSSDTIKLFDSVFGDKIKASVGQYDETEKSKIASVDFAGFVPAERKDGSVALALQVTYENGAKKIKPMTKGRTSEGDDPVMTYTPKELVGTIKARAMMADMIERPEYWDKMGAEVAANFGRRSAQQKEAPQESEYRKARVKIIEDESSALAEIEYTYGEPKKGSDDEALKKKAIAAVRSQFEQRKNKLGEIYGKKAIEEPPEAGNGKNKAKYISKIDGVDASGVIKKFMEANKNLTEQQATQIAIQQGYLSNGQ
ncbi:hypothetical protein [Pseudoalteromonas sp.]|uniref:hypothetical protein n=1 Tax=Pseudoalteromonas sp. TaxID=53249 RepID=UPI0026103553|nr:hypothetical protein [Pseudoalteromonas sp.]MCP3702986.1 hypothetical protein [Alteromonas sp.]MCP4587641.1 hypothetical protein [Pseudoalteromonas sp.]